MQTGAKAKDLKVLTIVKSTERVCPKCQAVLCQNNNEECYECLNCGYTDCAGDK